MKRASQSCQESFERMIGAREFLRQNLCTGLTAVMHDFSVVYGNRSLTHAARVEYSQGQENDQSIDYNTQREGIEHHHAADNQIKNGHNQQTAKNQEC